MVSVWVSYLWRCPKEELPRSQDGSNRREELDREFLKKKNYDRSKVEELWASRTPS